MDFDINDMASVGVVRDTPSWQLPPEAFTLGLNMRFVDEAIQTLAGWSQVFGTPGVAPHFAMSVVTPTTKFWIYASLTKIYGYDGTTHTNITRQSAGVDVNYTASDTPEWNGTFLGGVPLLNNGIDVPQFWSPIGLATKMQNLTNWPATLRAKVLRGFGPHLIAINCTKSGTAFPHLVKWSHPADPGSVPVSWDETDPTRDAGEVDLTDTASGLLVDALQLGDTMYLFKEQSTWKMRYIGGQFIFDFGQGAWLTTSGILAPRCVCVTSDGQRQVVVTQDDIIWHNGNTLGSILDKKQKRRLFNEIDTGNFFRSFVFDNPQYKEVWFCYPSAGAEYPDRALVMNYSDQRRWPITEVDGITFRHAATGALESPNEEAWDDGDDEWEDDTGPWSELLRRRTILSGTDSTKLLMLDSGTTRDGLAFSGTLQRLGLGLIGKKRDGSPIVDFQRQKLVKRLGPKITGSPVSVRFGTQQTVDGPISWGQSVTYDPGLQKFCDPEWKSGNAIGFEISGADWKMDGYKITIEPLGMFP